MSIINIIASMMGGVAVAPETPVVPTTATPLGTIVNTNFGSISALPGTYINESKATITFPSGYMRVAVNPGQGSVNNELTNNIIFNDLNALDDWELETRFKANNNVIVPISINRSDIIPSNPSFGGAGMFINNQGQIRMFTHGGTLTNQFYIAGFSGWINTDEVVMRFTQQGGKKYFCYAKNIRTTEEITGSLDLEAVYPTTKPDGGIGYPQLSFFEEADVSIAYFKVSSTALVNADIMFIGDSITSGTSSLLGYDFNYPNRLRAHTEASIVTLGVPSMSTSNLLTAMPSVIRMHAKNIFLMIGANDVFGGDSAATIFGRIQNIYNQLTADGSKVYLLAVTPIQGKSKVGELNALMQAAYPTRYIDVNTPYNDGAGHMNSAAQSPDDLHPGNYELMANAVKAAVPTLFPL